MTPSTAHRAGNTLIEVVVATVLVGVVIVAALETLGSAARTHRVSATASEAWHLAARHAAGITGAAYDSLQSSASAAIPGLAGWSLEVIVAYCESVPSGSTISNVVSDQGLKRVQVRVTDPAGRVVEYETLRSRYGAGMYPTPLGLPQVGGVTATLSVAGAAVQQFAELPLNEAPTP